MSRNQLKSVGLVSEKFHLGACEDMTPVEGWHNPTKLWNGWNTPSFEFRRAINVMDELLSDGAIIGYAFDKGEGVIISQNADDDEVDVWEVDVWEVDVWEVDVNGLYPIGAFAWTWEVYKR